MSDDLFEELSNEELEKYIDDGFGGTDEYKNAKKQNRIDNYLKSVQKISSEIGRVVGELGSVPDNLPDLKNAYSYQLLSSAKALWSKCYQIYSLNPVSKKGKGLLSSIPDGIFNAEKIAVEKLDNGYIHLVLPGLIPHKKMKDSMPKYGDNYRLPIYYALSQTFPTMKPVFDVRVAVLITHVFSEGDMIDYDNFDYVHLLNAIADFFLVDDSPLYYSLHINMRAGENSHTEVHVLPEKDFYTLCLKYPDMFVNRNAGSDCSART